MLFGEIKKKVDREWKIKIEKEKWNVCVASQAEFKFKLLFLPKLPLHEKNTSRKQHKIKREDNFGSVK